MGKKRKSGGFRGGKGSDPDFAKKKVKVGKTLAKANSTNTSFRSRAINVAVQRPVENGAGSTEGGGGGATPTNERGLNFQDLLARCGHYQPNTRKDALQGLRSLFSMNTGYVRLRLGYIKEGRWMGGRKEFSRALDTRTIVLLNTHFFLPRALSYGSCVIPFAHASK